MNRSLATLVLATLLYAPAAGAPVFHGLGLDHPGLTDVFVGCPACADTAAIGVTASVKGAQNGSNPGSVIGRFQGGVVPNQARVSFYIGSANPNSSNTGWTSGDSPGTLAPPFASGALFRVYNTGPLTGPFLQALLYEPDQVTRKTSANKSSIKLKQNGSVAIRQGSVYSSYFASGVSVTKIQDCKAQAEIKFSESEGSAKYKMKLRCSGKSAAVRTAKTVMASAAR